ncbi:inovirus-type Gp2 protein [Chitinibacter sp. S2-10]|uniref:YagK/YfjJ domain-containing protein n=1 Tax=Chitinibacter sp. S2-10 TaxID=3373597 RepID=UPI0039775A6F
MRIDIDELFDTTNTRGIAYNAMIEDGCSPERDNFLKDPTFVFDRYGKALLYISSLEQKVRDIVNSNEPGYGVIIQRNRKVISQTYRAGLAYMSLAQNYQNQEIQQILATKILNPYLDLLTRIWPTISNLDWRHYSADELMPNGKLAAEMFNVSLQDLRAYAESTEFKKRCDVWYAESTQQYRSCKAYVEYLFSRYARLLVVRLDLGFVIDSELRADVIGCRERLQRFLRNKRNNSLFDHQVGYIWRLEFGIKKGWHYHCILFFDGSKSQQDVSLGDAIGNYWRKVVTQGQGTYWNCNRHKDRYSMFKLLGVGMIHHSEEDKRDNLLKAVTYLCKMDEYLRQALPDGVTGIHTFGRGKIPSNDSGSVRRGRPRSGPDDGYSDTSAAS